MHKRSGFPGYANGNARLTIRGECSGDISAVRIVNRLAFGQTAEANLVDLLRKRHKLLLSLVASFESRIVGHIAFSPVRILPESQSGSGAGLGPMAVIPEYQRMGIGSALVTEGLRRCRQLGLNYVVVLGHASYYPRFGLSPAARYGLTCIWPVPEGAFMALELNTGSLCGKKGTAAYEPEFSDVTPEDGYL